jgi:hypothetical protein
MKLEEALEMSYPRALVQQIILGLTDPLNQHLIKLAGFDFAPEQRRHFRREVRTWLDKIQRLRIKPQHRPGSFKFYYDLLFDYPFGGVEIQNMRTMMDLISEECGLQPTRSPSKLVEWLRQHHSTLADRLHNGEAVLDLIPDYQAVAEVIRGER